MSTPRRRENRIIAGESIQSVIRQIAVMANTIPTT